jgi:hypothetical protein
MTGYIDNADNGILVHVNIWFGIALMNLLLSSYTPQARGEKWSSARTWRIIQGKDFNGLKPP